MRIVDLYTSKQVSLPVSKNSIFEALSLTEMPVSNYQTVGDFDKAHSIKKPIDRKLVSAEPNVNRIKNAFAKTNVDFELFFVNMPGAAKHLEQGLVKPEWIAQNMPYMVDRIDTSKEAIFIIFTNNINGGKKFMGMPLTPWIIAHRIGHALYRSYNFGGAQQNQLRQIAEQFDTQINQICQQAYGTNLKPPAGSLYRRDEFQLPKAASKHFMQAIGTMKSARTGRLRDAGEMIHEMLAQYLITGKVTFNPLPKHIPYQFAWGNTTRSLYFRGDETAYNELNEMLQTLAQDMTFELDQSLGAFIGDIFVI